METKSGKPLDTRLAGVKCADARANKIDIMLNGVKLLDDLCDRLSKRMDAFEGSKDRDWFKNDAR